MVLEKVITHTVGTISREGPMLSGTLRDYTLGF
jgi:hypothetical protein